ncbi:MAG: SUMF1/EgtB/PvdO family nonheme iron enzyme [Kiritimatiellae bacterium]|nr:SUMF1/EgtB/PvdO family nonheme iron enzyme [Kiritimatiellia bacterium]
MHVNVYVVPVLLCALAANATPPQERVSPKDGAVQILVPGGEFVMGVDDPAAPMADEERPPHPVKLTPFWLDKYEVTNEQYAKFLNMLIAEGGTNWTDRQVFDAAYSRVLMEHSLCGLELNLAQRCVSVKKGQEQFPAMPVSWQAATEYAARMGRRLPTEAEWEYAARGTDGRRYPWGNVWQAKWANVHSGKPSAVDAFPRDVSPFGIVGLGGNAREWVQDYYEIGFYASSPKDNPVNSGGKGPARVIRGGSYVFTEWDARATSRCRGLVSDHNPQPATGIRTAEDAHSPTK